MGLLSIKYHFRLVEASNSASAILLPVNLLSVLRGSGKLVS